MRAALRVAALAVLIVLTVTLQITVFSHFSLNGVVPDLALLIVIAAALVRGAGYGALVGFAAGLVLDLAPPADHTAGRWALSFVLAGYLTGLVKRDSEGSVVGTVVMVAAGAFVGTSVFALTGLVLQDSGVTVASAFDVVPLAVLYDVMLTPLVIPLVVLLLRQLEPKERW
ncbi:MAG: rod shape-determining protein MreD [Nocardioidaceae bacterium]|nr:rod shape-determining protein MreD [Nocardioidaceae bacterium]